MGSQMVCPAATAIADGARSARLFGKCATESSNHRDDPQVPFEIATAVECLS